MDRDELIDKTRALLGDLELEGNTTEVTDDEIVAALNFAQEQCAILTHCTYAQVTAAVSAEGLVDLSTHDVLDVDRVMTPEADPNPDATISVPVDPVAGVAFHATVTAQTGASFAWSVAGARIQSGQGTRDVTLMAATEGVAVITCAVALGGKVDRKTKTVTVAEA